MSIAGPCHLGRGVPLLQGLAKVLGLLQRVRAEVLLPDYFLVDLIGVLASPAINLIDHPWNRVLDHIWLPGSIERDILLERVGRGFDRTGTAVIGIMVRWANSGEFHDANRERDFEEQLKDVEVPALFVTGDRDTAVPWPSVEEAFRNLRGPDKTWREFGIQKDGTHFGHCDLICGREAPRVVWPVIGEWLKERDVPDVPERPRRSGRRRPLLEVPAAEAEEAAPPSARPAAGLVLSRGLRTPVGRACRGLAGAGVSDREPPRRELASACSPSSCRAHRVRTYLAPCPGKTSELPLLLLPRPRPLAGQVPGA